MKSNNRIFYIDLLRFIAAIFITNSHFNGYYPIDALATGGALGNALFFFISGYCLAYVQPPFFQWYTHRIARIIPEVYMLTILRIGISDITIETPKKLFEAFIWPTEYWFIGAILIFYIIYYFVVKYIPIKNYWLVGMVVLSIYLTVYLKYLDLNQWVIEGGGERAIDMYFRYIYYFFIMLCGAYFRKRGFKIDKPKSFYISISFVSLGLLYVHKALIKYNNNLMFTQGLNHLFVIIFVLGLVTYLSNSSALCSKIEARYGQIISFIGGLTLEIYLVQDPVLRRCTNIIFPFNIICAVTIIIALAWATRVIVSLLFGFRKR